MSISNTITVAVILALSGSVAHAADKTGGTKTAPLHASDRYPQVTIDSFLHDNADGTAIASLRDRTPIGHRQPRTRDIPATTQLSPLELKLRWEDELTDKKIIICRGC